MIFRLLFYIVLVSVFLLGSTFSCVAFTYGEEIGGHHEYREKNVHDDCCPKEGHKKHIEGKDVIQYLQKQCLEIESCSPYIEGVSQTRNFFLFEPISFYRDPVFDKQSMFFADTIRLIL